MEGTVSVISLFRIFIKRIWSNDKYQWCPLLENSIYKHIKQRQVFFEKVNANAENKDPLNIPINLKAVIDVMHTSFSVKLCLSN